MKSSSVACRGLHHAAVIRNRGRVATAAFSRCSFSPASFSPFPSRFSPSNSLFNDLARAADSPSPCCSAIKNTHTSVSTGEGCFLSTTLMSPCSVSLCSSSSSPVFRYSSFGSSCCFSSSAAPAPRGGMSSLQTKTSLLPASAALSARMSRRLFRRRSSTSSCASSSSAAARVPSAVSAATVTSSAAASPLASSSCAASPSTAMPSSPTNSSVSQPSSVFASGGEELQSFFARAEVLVHLLHSRLALPLLYPFNSGGGLTHPLEQPLHQGAGSPSSSSSSRSSSSAADSDSGAARRAGRPPQSHVTAETEQQRLQRTAITSGWSRSAVLLGLAHVTPLVLAATKVANLLKIAHALSYYTGQAAAARQRQEQQRTLRLTSTLSGLLASSSNSTTVTAKSPQEASDPEHTQEQVQQHVQQQTAISTSARKQLPVRKKKSPSLTSHPSMRSRIHFLRPQLWRVMKPGDEQRTKHLGWR